MKSTATEQKSGTREPKAYARFQIVVSYLMAVKSIPLKFENKDQITGIAMKFSTSGYKLIRFAFFCYRCFVTYVGGQWYCHFNECALAYDGKRFYPDANQASIVCQDIKEAQNSQCSRECAQNIHLSSSVLNSLPAVRAEFE